MLAKLQAFVSNGQAVAATTALVVAVFGVLVATGAIQQAPDTGFVGSVVAVAFTAAGLVLAYIQHSQTQQSKQQNADLTHAALALGLSIPQLLAKLNEPASSPAKAAPTAPSTPAPATS